MKAPAFLWRHRVVVEPYLGPAGYGPRYGAPVEVLCLLERSTRVVKKPDGTEVTSSATFRTALDRESVCPPESRVTLPDGGKTTVINVQPQDGAGLPVPNHLEVSLE